MLDWSSLTHLLRLIPRAQLAAAVILVLAASAIEALGLLLLLPLLQAVGVETGQGTLQGAAASLGTVLGLVGLQPTLGTVLVVYLGLAGIQAVLQWCQGLLNMRTAQGVVSEIRRATYRAISRADWVFLARRRSSEFAHVLTDESDRVGSAVSLTIDFVVSAAIGLVYFGLALWMAPGVTTLVVVFGLVLVGVMRPQLVKARRSGEDVSRATGDLYTAVLEHLGSLKTALSFGAEERHARDFGKRADGLQSVRVRSADEYGRFTQALVLGSTGGLAVIVYVSVRFLDVSTGELLLLLFVFARLMPRMTGLYEKAQGIVTQLPALAKVADAQRLCLVAGRAPGVAAAPVEFTRAIRLAQVRFHYSPEAPPALCGVDLTIPAGATTAIVGPSGAGKSTIADLLLGLIVPSEGSLLVDDRPLAPASAEAWRRQIGYVPQETFLFHDTVRANLEWARPGATDDEIWEALRLASADELVRSLPRGLDAVLGDRGVLVSGGERQRLSLARALLRRPRLLVLDEATSSLDGESEARIQRSIDGLHHQMTIVAITHRLSAIRHADLIHVVEQGRMVESGTWDDLISRPGGRFQAMWRVQETRDGARVRAAAPFASAGASGG